MHDKLKYMKDTLICAAEIQMSDLMDADTEELGAVIDMIKDLEEAIYYATVTAAMHAGDTWEVKKDEHHTENDRMYYMGSRYPMMYAEDSMINDDRDMREGRSHLSRKMYMEARDMKKDKATQLRELEKYMQELSQDIVEMISEASPEEK